MNIFDLYLQSRLLQQLQPQPPLPWPKVPGRISHPQAEGEGWDWGCVG